MQEAPRGFVPLSDDQFYQILKEARAMKIILSIKPEFANRILEGTKAYESEGLFLKIQG